MHETPEHTVAKSVAFLVVRASQEENARDSVIEIIQVVVDSGMLIQSEQNLRFSCQRSDWYNRIIIAAPVSIGSLLWYLNQQK